MDGWVGQPVLQLAVFHVGLDSQYSGYTVNFSDVRVSLPSHEPVESGCIVFHYFFGYHLGHNHY